ncbi:MAG: DUF433 domain-containing protein [Rhizobiales bacterium]|nr:DUF433 domain-containing protein [Hyphomicrobiales bacterium]MBI3671955.1 DUF433 domain-containing protein [Hyphomicrobiales bacterium]
MAKKVLSANEAASVTGVPLKHVHRIVDAGLLKSAVENRHGTRVIIGNRGLRGSRIPVHDIAAMIANGDEKSAIINAYPQLAPEQIDLAVLYAEAYPRRGRPRRKPLWGRGQPKSSEKLVLRNLQRAS